MMFFVVVVVLYLFLFDFLTYFVILIICNVSLISLM